MANTYTSLNYHVVFSTKSREPWLSESIRERLFPYLGGIARENAMKALEIGGAVDHVHLLLSLSPNLALAKAVQLIKGGSSPWLKDVFPELNQFAWQDGYAAFTISQSRDWLRSAFTFASKSSIIGQEHLRRNTARFCAVMKLISMSASFSGDFNRRDATWRLRVSGNPR